MTDPAAPDNRRAKGAPNNRHRVRETGRGKAFDSLGRIRVRLLVVNLVVLLVPVAGLEFARIYERQLLDSLERDMRNQAVLVRETAEGQLDEGAINYRRSQLILTAAARQTRTRVRVLDRRGETILDSHAHGPPEGPEPESPTLLPSSAYEVAADVSATSSSLDREASAPSTHDRARWPEVPDRSEVVNALRGHPDAYTRIREPDERDRSRSPGVFLFVTEPIRHGGEVVGVVYVTRSTTPVLAELYKIRTGLIEVLVVALVFTLILTLMLSWSISRPLSRLVRAARRIADGEPNVDVPVGGGGEIRELGEAFSVMTRQLDARMRYITDFAADVAHELKSPLTSIRGAAELLREGAADDPTARERFLSNIQLDAERLDRLVNRLLELSRIDASREPMEPLDLRELVARVVARTHTEEQPVKVRYEAAVKRYAGRAEDLERALLNLVENAVRFSPEGEPVIVRVRARDARTLEISVEDRGPGVNDADREKIFERFFTTDADRNGTGLGLAIVKSVAHAHRGSVSVERAEAGGARFSMLLPHEGRA